MPKILWKIIFKLMRALNINSLIKIKAGPCAGLKWSVSIPDSRYLLGTYEPALAEIVTNEVGSGKRLVDIGANAGYFSLLAAVTNPKKLNHIAIEPFPENITLLKEHMRVNERSNVLVEQLAVAYKAGEIEFSNSGNLAANTYKKESTIFGEDKINVVATTLSDLAREHKLDNNCFIKIDVEGAEMDVLSGGESYLKEHHPTLLLATHNCHVQGVKKECLDFIQSIGYNYRQVEDEKIEGQVDFLCFVD